MANSGLARRLQWIAGAITLLLLVVVLLILAKGPKPDESNNASSNENETLTEKKHQPRTIAKSAYCDLELNFHGQPDDYLRAEYWYQQLVKTLGSSDVDRNDPAAINSQPLRFCSVLRHDMYSSECPEQLGRAWCAPQEQPASSAQQLTSKLTREDSNAQSQLHIVFADSGLANTRNGVIYIKRNASVEVLQHELGHALGLADEYTMHPELARQFCNGEFKFTARNLVITRKPWLTPSEMQGFQDSLPWHDFLQQPLGEQENNGIWRLGSQDETKIGLFPAETCEGVGLFAWKPVAEKTWMEQHEIGVIPHLYLNLIRQHLNELVKE